MKTLLFPHRFQKVGWVILSIALLVDVYVMIGWWGNGNIMEFFTISGDVTPSAVVSLYGGYVINNIAIISTIVGALLVTCSREKVEDEMITAIRHNSLLVALYVNYGLLIIAALVFYDLDFLTVMIYGMFSILLIFLVVFRYKLWQARKGGADE
ncbi:MAG: hypothetical protein E7134_05510 [Rikenellaceae bacterium]|nr:hypothetical protein [Rikenellaceae bacterium]